MHLNANVYDEEDKLHFIINGKLDFQMDLTASKRNVMVRCCCRFQDVNQHGAIMKASFRQQLR